MRFAHLWVGLSCMVLALSVPHAHPRAETANDTPSTSQSQSAAVDVVSLKMMTFRDVGQPRPTALASAATDTSSGAGSGAWSISRVADANVYLDSVHSAYSRPRYSSSRIPGWVEKEFFSNWDIEGEIGVVSGSSTYANHNEHFFKLSETFTSRSDNEFEFYQEYGVDHYYYNSRELLLGAQQDFDSIWLNGGLRLTEEFRDYTDIAYSQNNRQSGLFKLRFDPRTKDGRWRGLFDYRYGVKTYETFSTRSYILHSARFRLDYPLSCTVSGEGRVRFDDYNYSVGSTRSFNRLGYGNTLTWEPNGAVRLSAAVDKDKKDYEITTDRSYERQVYRGALRWQPDCKTQIDLKGVVTDYDRELSPERSYQDNVAEVRLQRDLSTRWDLDARIVERQKDYDIDPLDDLDLHRRKVGLNYNADCNWNFGVSWDETQYDYAYLAREFERDVYVVDGTYSTGNMRFTGAWRTTQTDFTVDPLRDYTRNDYNLDADWRCGVHQWRAYLGIADLTQSDPASINGYDETRYGARWKYQLSCDVDFELEYYSSERVYETRDTLRNDQLFGKLSFEL